MRRAAKAAAFVTSTLRDDAEVKNLAGLSLMDYDRERKLAAKKLNCRVGTLDRRVEAARAKNHSLKDAAQGKPIDLPEIDPWPDPVDGAELLDRLSATIGRHVVLEDKARDAAALWVVAVHAFQSFCVFPRMFVTAPTKGAGKSTLLDAITPLVPRPLSVASATAATLFRVISAWRPVLLLDEADLWMRDNENVRLVINSGHKQGQPVLRCVGDENEPRAFDVFAPAVLAAIGRLPDTIEDRSIIVRLQRKRHNETVEPLSRGRGVLLELARKTARWSNDHTAMLAEADPAMPASIANRAADNWKPLLAVADLAGGDWPEKARRAATVLSGSEDSDRLVMLLADIRALLGENEDRIASEDLTRRLIELDARPWAEFRSGNALTKAQLARMLSRVGVTTQDIRIRKKVFKGYMRSAFADAWDRYLSAGKAQHRDKCDETSTSGAIGSATPGDLLRFETGQKPNDGGFCRGVALWHWEVPAEWTQ